MDVCVRNWHNLRKRWRARSWKFRSGWRSRYRDWNISTRRYATCRSLNVRPNAPTAAQCRRMSACMTVARGSTTPALVAGMSSVSGSLLCLRKALDAVRCGTGSVNPAYSSSAACGAPLLASSRGELSRFAGTILACNAILIVDTQHWSDEIRQDQTVVVTVYST